MESTIKLYPYRWVILILAFLVHCVLNGGILLTAGMAAQIMPAFDLSTSQFAMVASVPFLAGFIFGIPAGTWADRSSIKKVMTVGLILATIGAVGRIWATGFWSLFLLNFIMGFALAALNANSAKLFRLWFPGKMMSLAMGVYVAGATVGSAGALAFGPLFPSISSGMIFIAVLMVVTTILWILLAKTHPDGESSTEESVMKHLGAVLKSKNLWVASLIMFLVLGAAVTENSFMSVGFNVGNGVDPIKAALLASMTNIAVSIGGIIVPTVVGRLGKMKAFIIPTTFIMAALVLAGWFVNFGALTYVIFFIQGILMGGVIPLTKTIPALLPDIKLEQTGAAGGIQSAFQNLGAFIVPSYIIAPLAGDNYTYIFIGAAIIMVVIGLATFLLPETGTSLEHRKDATAAS